MGERSVRFSSSLNNVQHGIAGDCCADRNDPRGRILAASTITGVVVGAIAGEIALPPGGFLLGAPLGGLAGFGVGKLIVKVLEELGELKPESSYPNNISRDKFKR